MQNILSFTYNLNPFIKHTNKKKIKVIQCSIIKPNVADTKRPVMKQMPRGSFAILRLRKICSKFALFPPHTEKIYYDNRLSFQKKASARQCMVRGNYLELVPM